MLKRLNVINVIIQLPVIVLYPQMGYVGGGGVWAKNVCVYKKVVQWNIEQRTKSILKRAGLEMTR